MYLTYSPAEQDVQRWEFKLGQLRAAETEAIERRTGLDYLEFQGRLLQGNTKCRRALLWTLLRRKHHTLRYEDVDFAFDEVEVGMDQQEWAETREMVLKNNALSDGEREEQLAAIDLAAADAPEAPGKAPEPTSEIATG